MSYYDYGYVNPIFMVAALVIAVVVGIALHFTFLSADNENRFEGFLGWLYDFLSFRKLWLETILKVVYLVLACYFTLAGFFMLFSSFITGLMMIVFGNIMIRITFEFSMLLILICKNVSDINKKMGSTMPTTEKPIMQNASPSAKYCVQCGAQAPSDASFCDKCGQKL